MPPPALTVTPASEPGSRFFFDRRGGDRLPGGTDARSSRKTDEDQRDPGSEAGVTKKELRTAEVPGRPFQLSTSARASAQVFRVSVRIASSSPAMVSGYMRPSIA